MKRLLTLLMALAMTASLAACGGTGSSGDTADSGNSGTTAEGGETAGGEEKKWTALSSGPWKIRKEAPGRDDPEQPLIALHKGL